jgi:hypothetical protein
VKQHENFSSYLVGLHRFKHAEATNVDNANLMTLASSRIEIHQWHDVLRVLCIGRVSGDVHNLTGMELNE